jgi:hypothetical protein
MIMTVAMGAGRNAVVMIVGFGRWGMQCPSLKTPTHRPGTPPTIKWTADLSRPASGPLAQQWRQPHGAGAVTSHVERSFRHIRK